jgi:hypothetical protein
MKKSGDLYASPVQVFVDLVRGEGSQNLAAGALSYSTNFGHKTRITSVLLHATVAISQVVTITFDSKSGSNFDVMLDSTTLSSASNYVYFPDGDLILDASDNIVVTCANSGSPASSVFVTVFAENLN